MIRQTLVGALAVFCALAMATQGTAAQFTTLTYNVRGLPFPAIEDRTAEIAAIAPLLEDFHDAGGVIDGIESIVLLQELFDQNYYNTITDPQTISYPNVTAKDSSGTFGLGDGLNMLSDFLFANFDRTTWNDCHGTGGADGSDCDTPKGFSFARFDFGDGLQVDVYNLHADAGQDESSRLARRNNIDQLISAINTRSPAGTAVIVMGDTNSLYTRSPDDNVDSLRSGPGLTDVWVELVNGGVVPAPGPEIESGCETDPSGPDCEMIDKVFYRSGDSVILTPLEYSALKTEFSDAGGDLSDHIPVAVLFDVSAGATTTTSTTTTTVTVSSTTTVTVPSTTTTTLPPGDTCADPVALTAGRAASASAVTASDALFILGAAVGIQTCELCVCDADGSGGVAATDALITLQAAVGQPVTLQCPPCS